MCDHKNEDAFHAANFHCSYPMCKMALSKILKQKNQYHIVIIGAIFIEPFKMICYCFLNQYLINIHKVGSNLECKLQIFRHLPHQLKQISA